MAYTFSVLTGEVANNAGEIVDQLDTLDEAQHFYPGCTTVA